MSGNYVITISRGYGSGGKQIAVILSEMMNIPYYDRDLLSLASEDSGINIELFGKRDENVKKGLLAGDKYTGSLIAPQSSDFVSDKNLFNYQAKTIKELAEKESCIIVGRCADFVLKDYPDTLDVLIWAPGEDCIQTVLEREPILTRREAERKIKKVNERRSEYYKYYTDREWMDFTNYDLCVNSSAVGYEKSALMIKACAEIKFR